MLGPYRRGDLWNSRAAHLPSKTIGKDQARSNARSEFRVAVITVYVVGMFSLHCSELISFVGSLNKTFIHHNGGYVVTMIIIMILPWSSPYPRSPPAFAIVCVIPLAQRVPSMFDHFVSSYV